MDTLWVVPLPRIPVTTRIIPCLVGNPELNLHLPLLLGGGTTQDTLPTAKIGCQIGQPLEPQMFLSNDGLTVISLGLC